MSLEEILRQVVCEIASRAIGSNKFKESQTQILLNIYNNIMQDIRENYYNIKYKFSDEKFEKADMTSLHKPSKYIMVVYNDYLAASGVCFRSFQDVDALTKYLTEPHPNDFQMLLIDGYLATNGHIDKLNLNCSINPHILSQSLPVQSLIDYFDYIHILYDEPYLPTNSEDDIQSILLDGMIGYIR